MPFDRAVIGGGIFDTAGLPGSMRFRRVIIVLEGVMRDFLKHLSRFDLLCMDSDPGWHPSFGYLDELTFARRDSVLRKLSSASPAFKESLRNTRFMNQWSFRSQWNCPTSSEGWSVDCGKTGSMKPRLSLRNWYSGPIMGRTPVRVSRDQHPLVGTIRLSDPSLDPTTSNRPWPR